MANRLWVRGLFLIILCVSAYSLALKAPFRTMDDQISIVHNPLIRSTQHIKEIFTQGYFGDRSYYRPLINLSFLGEYQIFGLNSFDYNRDNLLIHIINTFLVWILASLLLENVQVSFWVALLFAIHPIHAEAVNNIAGRAILMGALFSLLSFILFLMFQRKPRSSGLALLGASMGAFILGLLSKESTAILPGVMLVYLWIKRKPIWPVLPFFLIIIIYILFRLHLGITQTLPWSNASERILGFVTFLYSLLTDARLLIVPLGLHFDRSQVMFMSYEEGMFLVTVFVWILVIGALWINRQKISAFKWFLVIWLALEMLPVSQIVTTIGVAPGVISCADHFLYMASIPVFIILVDAVKKLWQFNNQQQWLNSRIIQLILAVFLIFLFLMNIEQNMYASSEQAMLQRSVQMQPDNARAQWTLGSIYVNKGKFVEGQEHFALALKEDPNNPRYQISLAQSICDQGRYQECLDLYNQIQEAGSFKELLEHNKQAVLRLMHHD
jgi:hypothetical protein